MKKSTIKRVVSIACAGVMLASFAACDKSSVSEVVGDIPVLGSVVREKINLADCVTANFSGFDGSGRVVISENYEKLDSLVSPTEIQEFLYKKDPQVATECYSYGGYVTFSDFFVFQTEKEYLNLQNGSEITVCVKLHEDFENIGVTFEDVKDAFGIDFDERLTFKASGLTEGISVDVLSDLTQYITYAGANGFGSASLDIPETYSKESNGFYIVGDGAFVKVIYNNECILNFLPEFEGENKYNLKGGDVIQLSAKGYETYLGKYNAFFKDVVVDVTVPDLGEYATSPSQLTQAQIQQMRTDVYNGYAEDAFGGDTYESLETYYGTLQPTAISDTNSKFAMFFVVKESTPDFWYGGYMITYHLQQVYDIQLKPDGTIDYVITDCGYESFGSQEELNEFINANERYVYTKLG